LTKKTILFPHNGITEGLPAPGDDTHVIGRGGDGIEGGFFVTGAVVANFANQKTRRANNKSASVQKDKKPFRSVANMPKTLTEKVIESYKSGLSMRVAGKTYTTDLKIIGDTVKDNWWRREGHRLLTDDIVDILESRPDVLVIGTGYAGNLAISDNLRKCLAERGVQIVSDRTAKAVELFNQHRARNENVAGAFHLTC